MKSFTSMVQELNEAKSKLPSGHKEVKSEVTKVGGKSVDIVYSSR